MPAVVPELVTVVVSFRLKRKFTFCRLGSGPMFRAGSSPPRLNRFGEPGVAVVATFVGSGHRLHKLYPLFSFGPVCSFVLNWPRWRELKATDVSASSKLSAPLLLTSSLSHG